MRYHAALVVLSVSLCGSSMIAAQAPSTAPEQTPLLDDYGDPLPKGALLRLGTTRLIHKGYVLGAFVAPDGKTVESIDSYGRVFFWDVATGKYLRGFQLEDHLKRDIGSWVALSPDRKKLATGGEKGVYFWDNATGKCLAAIVEDLPEVSYLHKPAFTPDGSTLLAYSSDNFQLFRLDASGVKKPVVIDLEVPTKVKGKKTEFYALSHTDFSPDRKWFAGGNSYHQEVFIWDTTTGKVVKRLSDHLEYAWQICFSPDSKILAVICGNSAVRVWDMKSGKLLHEFADGGHCIAFAPDGKRLFARQKEHEFQIFDLATGKSIRRTLDSQRRSDLHQLRDVEFLISPDGKLLVAFANIDTDIWPGGSERLLLYDIDTGKLLGLGHDAPLDPRGRIAIAAPGVTQGRHRRAFVATAKDHLPAGNTSRMSCPVAAVPRGAGAGVHRHPAGQKAAPAPGRRQPRPAADQRSEGLAVAAEGRALRRNGSTGN